MATVRLLSREVETSLVQYISREWPDLMASWVSSRYGEMKLMKSFGLEPFEQRIEMYHYTYVVQRTGSKAVIGAVRSRIRTVFGVYTTEKVRMEGKKYARPKATPAPAAVRDAAIEFFLSRGLPEVCEILDEGCSRSYALTPPGGTRSEPIRIVCRSIQRQEPMEGQFIPLIEWLVRCRGIKENSVGLDRLRKKLPYWEAAEKPQATRIEWRAGKQISEAYRKCEGAVSCMTGSRHTHTRIYAINPKHVRLAVLFLGKDQIPSGRCLVWAKADGDKRIWYPDRVYPPDNHKITDLMKHALQDEAKKMKATIVWWRDKLESKNTMHPVFRLKLPKNGMLPYFDTLRYGQALSDGTGLFCVRPKQLIATMPGEEDYKGPGFEVDAKPITSATSVSDIHGGPWLSRDRCCNHCGATYYNEPLSDPIDTWTNNSVGVCKNCWTLLVLPWTSPQFSKSNQTLRPERPVYKKDCQWSENLQAHVHPRSWSARHDLVRVEIDGKLDWYLNTDPRYLEIRKKASSQQSSGTPSSSNIGGGTAADFRVEFDTNTGGFVFVPIVDAPQP